MKIIIQGQDYTAALDAARPLAIERNLNEPSVCTLSLTLPTGGSLPAPQRNQSIAITGDDGTLYFTGYLASTPLPEYAGLALEGPRYRLALQAISDELLLDQAGMAPARLNIANTAASLVTSLVTRTGQATLSPQSLTLVNPVFNVPADPAAPFSRSAGAVAANARASYRALNAALSLAQIPATIHSLNESDGSLTLSNLSFTSRAPLSSSTGDSSPNAPARSLANDITVCGAHEPAAYVTEYFQGDGVTSTFYLSDDPFLPPSADRSLIRELFNETQIDTRLWVNAAGSAILSLGAGGLTMNGGNGLQGENTLAYVNQVEMGGTLLVEATGVTLAAGGSGILAGLFTAGSGALNTCAAGFLATPQAAPAPSRCSPLSSASLWVPPPPSTPPTNTRCASASTAASLSAISPSIAPGATRTPSPVAANPSPRPHSFTSTCRNTSTASLACPSRSTTAQSPACPSTAPSCRSALPTSPVPCAHSTSPISAPAGLPPRPPAAAPSRDVSAPPQRPPSAPSRAPASSFSSPASPLPSATRLPSAIVLRVAPSGVPSIPPASKTSPPPGFLPSLRGPAPSLHPNRAARRIAATPRRRSSRPLPLPTRSGAVPTDRLAPPSPPTFGPATHFSSTCPLPASTPRSSSVPCASPIAPARPTTLSTPFASLTTGQTISPSVPALPSPPTHGCPRRSLPLSSPISISSQSLRCTIPRSLSPPASLRHPAVDSRFVAATTPSSPEPIPILSPAATNPPSTSPAPPPAIAITSACTTEPRRPTTLSSPPPSYSTFLSARNSNPGFLTTALMRMMNEFEAQVLSDLSVLKAQMIALTGDGNGGRIAELEHRMDRHEQNWQRAKGFLAAASVVLALLEVAVESWLRR